MGKKRIFQETEEDALVESERVEQREEKQRADSTGKKIRRGRLYINSSYNNTIITATDERGNVIARSSAGALGFRGPKKATPFAASRVMEVLNEKLHRTGLKEVAVVIQGIGGGREAALRSIPTHGYEIVSIQDRTPVPHNGPRPPKPRRV